MRQMIVSGVKPAETIVTDGQSQLVDGSHVQIKNDIGTAHETIGVRWRSSKKARSRRYPNACSRKQWRCDALGGQTVNISEIFIKRPIATTLVMLAILVFGVMGYVSLPVGDTCRAD